MQRPGVVGGSTRILVLVFRTTVSPIRISERVKMSLLLFALGLLVSGPAVGAPTDAPSADGPTTSESRLPVCEDFAKRQVGLADRLLGQSNYSRALKVLNSTAKNCEREFVREKIFEVMSEWFEAIRDQGTSALQSYMGVLSNQAYLTSSQTSQLEQRVQSHVRSLIGQQFSAENYQATYQLCRQYSEYTSGNFRLQYYCGTSAEELGAEGVAMNAYEDLLENWSSDQSLASWGEIANKLESLYFLNGRFEAAYSLAREIAVRDPSPKAVLSSLVSARGAFLSPLLQVGSIFYEQDPGQAALSHVDTEMQRVDFPKYVRAFYLLGEDGSVERGMYGSEANAPSSPLLETASGRVSLLQSDEDSNLAWLVSPVGSQFLILEFGIATTPEENVRLENVLENVRSDEQWEKLYQLEFGETYPASGSAIGTLLSGALIANHDFDSYDVIFDDSPVLTYYCIQSGSEQVEASYNFARSNLGYGESEWDRTSNTPALYHHSIEYSGQQLREVVWPNFVNEEWRGVIRVGLAQS